MFFNVFGPKIRLSWACQRTIGISGSSRSTRTEDSRRPRMAQESPKMAPQMAQDTSKTPPQDGPRYPRIAQEPKMIRDGPKMTHDGSRCLQDHSREGPNKWLKMVSRWRKTNQDSPMMAQDGSKTPQDSLRHSQTPPKCPLMDPQDGPG